MWYDEDQTNPPVHVQVSGTDMQELIVNASARPPRLAGLPTVGTCNYRYTGIYN